MTLTMMLVTGAVTLCAQFGLIPDNTKMGASFELSGFVFRDLGSSPGMFVNETAGEHGLQFMKAGLSVALPAPVTTVDLRVGVFSGPVNVRARNAAGNIVATQTVPGINKYVDIRLVATEITTVELTDGGDEGSLSRVCVAVAVCGCK